MSARRPGAAVIAVALVALVVCDVTIGSFNAWWTSHAFTASIVSDLLVVGVTALIVDEVIARRQRRDRAASVAVQTVIVYDEARRAFELALASYGAPDEDRAVASDEMRTLASMLLTASSTLFEDPQARTFLKLVQRLTGSIYQLLSDSAGAATRAPSRELLTSEMAQVRSAVMPLVARLPAEYGTVDEWSS